MKQHIIYISTHI